MKKKHKNFIFNYRGYIPDSVISIINGTFYGCTSLDDETKQRILEIQPNYQGW